MWYPVHLGTLELFTASLHRSSQRSLNKDHKDLDSARTSVGGVGDVLLEEQTVHLVQRSDDADELF